MRLITLLVVLCALHVDAALTASLNTFNDACGNGTGWIAVFVQGGQGAYTYAWSPAPPVGQGTNLAQALVAGTYTLTVTDALGEVATATTTVLAVPTLLPGNINGGNVNSCDGACNGQGPISFFSYAWGGLAPYTTNVTPLGSASVGNNNVYLSGLCPGSTYTCTVTDANGCSSVFSNIQVTDRSTPVLLDVQVTPSCAGGETGTAVLTYDQVGIAGSYNQFMMWTPYSIIGNQVFLNNLAPGQYSVSAYPYEGGGTQGFPPSIGGCEENTLLTIPVDPVPCGQLEGTVYVDLNGDCIQDAGDVPYPWRVVRSEPGGFYELTDQVGHYAEPLPYGAYTADITDLGDHAPLCPAVLPAPFTLNALTPNVTLDMALQPLYGPDMEALLTATSARPGFPIRYWLRSLNNGAFPFALHTVTLTYDPALTYLASSLTPTVNTPGLLQFDVAALAPFGQNNIQVDLQVPPDPLLIGTYLDATIALAPAPADAVPANDTYALSTLVVGAYDPNDKLVRTSTRASGTQYFLDADTALEYTIRFQNTGNAEALHVQLVDTLANTLDIGSLRLRGATHPFVARLQHDSILIIDFADIMLPDSTTDLLGSQGAFSFTIRPKSTIQPGTMIANKADIYFDFNPAIRTNTAALIAEFGTAVFSSTTASPLLLAPNPATDQVRITTLVTGPGEWMLQDALGRIAARGLWTGTSTLVPLSSLKAGMYTVTVRTAQGRSVARFAKE